MKTLLCFLGIALFCSFKKDNTPIREWTRYEIDFSDFKATADKKSSFDAVTECGIQYEMYVENDSAYIRVVAVLNRKKSWIKEKTPEVLNHEQGHFNICERSARMFRKNIANYKGELTAQNINEVMNKLLEEASESNRINQNMYESAVDDFRIQKYWDNLIVADIDSLSDYTSSLIIVGLKE